MSNLIVEEIDLSALAKLVRAHLGAHIEADYLRGLTVIRDVVAAQLNCSESEAEQLVETLELQGFVRFPHLPDDTHPSGRSVWHIK